MKTLLNFSQLIKYLVGGRLIRTTNALNNHTDYGYDRDGNRVNVTYYRQGAPVSTLYAYYRNHLLKTTDMPGFGPAGTRNITTNEYDGNGNLVKKTDAKGQVISYGYDKNNRLVAKADVSYAYSAPNNVINISDPNTDTENIYDDISRLTQVINKKFTPAKTITYSYNEDGTRATMNIPDPPALVNYTYDADKRLTRVAVSGTDIGGTADYFYNALGLRISIARSNGSHTDYAYALPPRWQTNVTNYGPTGNIVSSFDYTYDLVSNKTSMQLTNTDSTTQASYTDRVDYGYDDIYQLTGETRSGISGNSGMWYMNSWTYDEVGNRIMQNKVPYNQNPEQTFYTYNDANQMIQESGTTETATYVYDANGNQVRRISNIGTVTNLIYDVENRQIGYVYDDPVSTKDKSFTYTFDAMGRRIAKTDNVAITTEKYLYDGADIISDYDEFNIQKALYVTPFLDENLLTVRYSSPGETFWYLQGLVGSVYNLLDNSGLLVTTYEYDAWGNHLFGSADGHSTGSWGGAEPPTGGGEHGTNILCHLNRYRFTGREYDMESKSYYYRTRQYNQKTGRFNIRDLIGYLGGYNLYAYVGNNPSNKTDPGGLIDTTKNCFGYALEKGGATLEKKWVAPWPFDLNRPPCNGSPQSKKACEEANKNQYWPTNIPQNTNTAFTDLYISYGWKGPVECKSELGKRKVALYLGKPEPVHYEWSVTPPPIPDEKIKPYVEITKSYPPPGEIEIPHYGVVLNAMVAPRTPKWWVIRLYTVTHAVIEDCQGKWLEKPGTGEPKHLDALQPPTDPEYGEKNICFEKDVKGCNDPNLDNRPKGAEYEP